MRSSLVFDSYLLDNFRKRPERTTNCAPSSGQTDWAVENTEKGGLLSSKHCY